MQSWAKYKKFPKDAEHEQKHFQHTYNNAVFTLSINDSLPKPACALQIALYCIYGAANCKWQRWLHFSCSHFFIWIPENRAVDCRVSYVYLFSLAKSLLFDEELLHSPGENRAFSWVWRERPGPQIASIPLPRKPVVPLPPWAEGPHNCLEAEGTKATGFQEPLQVGHAIAAGQERGQTKYSAGVNQSSLLWTLMELVDL